MSLREDRQEALSAQRIAWCSYDQAKLNSILRAMSHYNDDCVEWPT